MVKLAEQKNDYSPTSARERCSTNAERFMISFAVCCTKNYEYATVATLMLA